MRKFGITQSIKEKIKLNIKRKTELITSLFILASVLPFIIYLLFHFNFIKSTPVFNDDIQAPVAKVQTDKSVGTAFLISPTKLLTAGHVVSDIEVGTEVFLIFEKAKPPRTVKGKLLYKPPSTDVANDNSPVTVDYFLSDVAVIEVAEIADILPLMLGESDLVNNLDEVILIGYPNADYSITKGEINSTSYQGIDLFKLDAASNPGNSGGPCILKSTSEVVGILVGGKGDAQGENIALKINNVKVMLERERVDINN